MKIRWKRAVVAGYLLLLLASFLYRQRNQDPVLPGGGWEMIELSVVGKNGVADSQRKVKMAYRELGSPDAPPLLLIHGSPAASDCFEDLIPELEKSHRLIIPDLPGFGMSRSRSLPDLSFSAHACYLAEFLRKRDFSGIKVLAYGMGGGAALRLEEMEPERIDCLVLLSSIGVQEFALLGDYLLNHVLHGLQLSAISAVQELVPHFGALDRFPVNRNYARNFYESDQRPLRALLEKWDKPLQIIHGRRDRLVPPEAAREHYRIVPRSRLDWIEGGTRLALMNRPGEVARLVAEGESQAVASASPERIREASAPIRRRRIDGTVGGKWTVMGLLGLATFGSEDLSCISGGVMASRKVIQFSTAAWGCFFGIALSDLALFFLGKGCSRWLVRFPSFQSKMDEFHVSAGKEWLERNAAKMIVASRFIPGSRVPTYMAMGAGGLGVRKFVVWLFVAAALWTPILVAASARFGDRLLPLLEGREKMIFPGFIGLLAAGVVTVRFVSAILTWKGRRLLLSKWRRLTKWEFWPAWAIYPFVLPALIKLSIRHRSFTVFTAANPALPCGGYAIEPKMISLRALQSSGNVPPFRVVASTADIRDFLSGEGVSFPIVLKPDEGERGRGVSVVHSMDEAAGYLSGVPPKVAIIAQSFAAGEEFGVFYYRYPNEESGRIYAITEKKMLQVVGDGRQTLEELILSDNRAVCMAHFFLKQLRPGLWSIPDKGERVPLSKLGTHSRGAIFLDGSHHITQELTAEIDRISKHFSGFYFGRYDLKAPSSDDLEKGRGLQILELNGVTSEATNMYDPGFRLFQGMKILRKQWEIAYAIGAINRELGHSPATIRELHRNYRAFQEQVKFESPAMS